MPLHSWSFVGQNRMFVQAKLIEGAIQMEIVVYLLVPGTYLLQESYREDWRTIVQVKTLVYSTYRLACTRVELELTLVELELTKLENYSRELFSRIILEFLKTRVKLEIFSSRTREILEIFSSPTREILEKYSSFFSSF